MGEVTGGCRVIPASSLLLPLHLKGYRCGLLAKVAGFLPVHTAGICLRSRGVRGE